MGSMRSGSAIWILCNCNSREEAKRIGEEILEARLGSCFDIFPRKLTNYFWPPQAGKIEEGKGALLVITTLESRFEKTAALIEKIHSDDTPFVGYIIIQGLSQKYLDWLQGEVET
jgi:periplasmic divalent cation tolerance protein